MQLLRAENHRVVPWKNGGGITREVALLADPEDTSGFLWRVSIATVSASGPFSTFEGIDRTIAVVEGQGMRLSIDGAEEVDLFAGGEPFSFAGEARVHSVNLDGETTDLNVMTKRDRCSHRMERLKFDGRRKIVFQGDENIVLFKGDVAVESAAGKTRAKTLDALVGIRAHLELELSGIDESEVFVISLWFHERVATA